MVGLSIDGSRNGVVENIGADALIVVVVSHTFFEMLNGDVRKGFIKLEVGGYVKEGLVRQFGIVLDKLDRFGNTAVEVAAETLPLQMVSGLVSVNSPVQAILL